MVKPKDRIVAAAAKLFYGHDAHTIGVDKVSEVAEVSKRTLYKHFPTKEALVSAAVNNLGQMWFEACTTTDSDDPAVRIKHVFKMIEPVAESDDFYGCVLMNTSIELRGTSDLANNAAKEFKTKLYEYFKQQATRLKAKNPDTLAEQLVLLHDGACAWIVMRRKFPASTLRAVDTLLNSATKNTKRG